VSYAVSKSLADNAAAEPVFNPLSPDFIRDPYPTYHRLLRDDPMHRSQLGFTMASRYADVAFILRDARFGKDVAGRISRTSGEKALEEPVYQSMLRWMISQNPPDHTRLRGLVVKAFSNRVVEDMRPRIQEIVDRLIDRIEPQGCMDLIADFAFRLPVTVIGEMLGIPKEDQGMVFKGDGPGARLLDPVPLSRAELDAANAGQLAAARYFHALFELRRRKPANDLMTLLVQAEEEGSRLSNEELTSNIILLYIAGHVTTTHLIGNALLALHRNPSQLDLLKHNPWSETAIDEFLRFESPVQVANRTALEDVTVGGKDIKKGETIFCLLGAANRDPAVYADPDRLDLTREGVRPLSFGGGVHYCLGAQLARIEAQIAIATLLRRLPNLTLDHPEAPDWRQTFVLRGLSTLPASW
jgi:cytochrome P450